MKKVHNFLNPPIIPNGVDFFEFGKIWETFETRKIFNFVTPQNCLKITLNDFCSTEAFKVYIYIWEKNENIAFPPPSYQKVQISNFELFHFLC